MKKYLIWLFIFIWLWYNSVNAFDLMTDTGSEIYDLWAWTYQMSAGVNWYVPDDCYNSNQDRAHGYLYYKWVLLEELNMWCILSNPSQIENIVISSKRFYQTDTQTKFNQWCFGASCERTLLWYNVSNVTSYWANWNYYYLRSDYNSGSVFKITFSKFIVWKNYIFDLWTPGHQIAYSLSQDLQTMTLIYDNVLGSSYNYPNMLTIPIINYFNYEYYWLTTYKPNFLFGSDNYNIVNDMPDTRTQKILWSFGSWYTAEVLWQAYILPYSLTPNPITFVNSHSWSSHELYMFYSTNVSFNTDWSLNNYSIDCVKNQTTWQCINYNTFTDWWIEDITFMSWSNLYFIHSSTLYRWNMNCINRDYTSCKADLTWQYYCSDDYGNKQPWNIKCSDESLNLWIITWWASSTTWTGTATTTSLESQTCTGVTMSWSSTFDTSEILLPSSCAWQTVSGSYRCQDNNWHLCMTNVDSCLSIISNPWQYASGSVNYWWDVTRYNCASSEYQCSWINSTTCDSNICVSDWPYCRVKPDYLKKVTNNSWSININWDISWGISSWVNFNMWELDDLWSGAICTPMFWSWWEFLYSRINNSNFNFTFWQDFKLSNTPWSCPIWWWLDFCNGWYTIIETIVKLPLLAVQSTMNFVLSPITTNLNYIGAPAKWTYHCFFWELKHFEGKPSTYYSWSSKSNINVDWQTNIDYLVIFLLIVVLLVVTFK